MGGGGFRGEGLGEEGRRGCVKVVNGNEERYGSMDGVYLKFYGGQWEHII